MGMATITCKISYEDREKLNELCSEKGVTTSELIRGFIRGELRKNDFTEQLEELKQMLTPVASINVPQLVYHVARASVSTIESTKLQNPDIGKTLNDNVKEIAEKLTSKILNG